MVVPRVRTAVHLHSLKFLQKAHAFLENSYWAYLNSLEKNQIEHIPPIPKLRRICFLFLKL